MFHAKKLMLSLAVLVAATGGVLPTQAGAARLSGHDVLNCVIDVVVESRNQTGLVVGVEAYHKEFALQEGGTFSDDFSTRTRFKFFDASFVKDDGEETVSAHWFADVTVFNSVDFSTSVTLADGAKRGKATGDNTVFTSTGSTTTTYTLTCVKD